MLDTVKHCRQFEITAVEGCRITAPYALHTVSMWTVAQFRIISCNDPRSGDCSETRACQALVGGWCLQLKRCTYTWSHGARIRFVLQVLCTLQHCGASTSLKGSLAVSWYELLLYADFSCPLSKHRPDLSCISTASPSSWARAIV